MKEKSYSIKSRKDRKGLKRRIRMTGDLSFRNARAIRDRLSKISFAEPELEMNLEEVERLDLTVIQILRALQTRANARGVRMEMNLALSDELEGLLTRVGFASYFKS